MIGAHGVRITVLVRIIPTTGILDLMEMITVAGARMKETVGTDVTIQTEVQDRIAIVGIAEK